MTETFADNQPAASDSNDDNTTVIQPRPGWHLIDLREMWRYRELLWILALRDIKVRYKQTFVGAAWAILQPITTVVIFTVIFKLLHAQPADPSTPYAVTVFAALLPWQLFATALAQSSESLVANQALITKVYFPRVIVPFATVLSALVDFAIALVVLLAMMAWYRITPGIGVLLLPVITLLAVLTAMAGGLWLSAINAIYRDFRYVVPFLVQVGMFVSPVVYETRSLVPERWPPSFYAFSSLFELIAPPTLYALNPMVGVIESFRWALLGKEPPQALPMAVSLVAVLVLLLGGMFYFRRMERIFADRV